MHNFFYDDFDYPSYWKGREFEQECEEIALKSFLSRIKNKGCIAEVGCGYGRLTNLYENKAKKIILSDASITLLKEAEKRHKKKKITFIHSKLEDLPKKIKDKSLDAIIMIRVMHHIKNPKEALSTLSKLTKKDGYLIIEFANKLHAKALTKNMLKGNTTYPMDIEPIDKRSRKKRNDKSIAFFNFHPHTITQSLKDEGFEIIEMRSVSNLRTKFAKKYIPIKILLWVERHFQTSLAKLYFGPSIFVLAKKKK